MHSSKTAALMPRDRYTNFSLVFYQNIAPAIKPLADMLGRAFGNMPPPRPGANSAGGSPMSALGSLKPSLIAAYAEPERITFAANGDLLGPGWRA